MKYEVASDDLRDALSVIIWNSSELKEIIHSELDLEYSIEVPYEEAVRTCCLEHGTTFFKSIYLIPRKLEDHSEDFRGTLPTPLLPPSFLSPRIRPLSPRALAAEMRDVASFLHHSLHPSGTPPLLPIPLPAPSTSRRDDIPEADTPPRKRLLLTTPRPECEVGESSAAAAARQPGPTMAHRVDYSLVDTMETRFRDTERRMMTALEMVNMRVSYQVDVRSRESSEFHSRHHDAQKDRAAVRAEIESEAHAGALEARVTVLETVVRRHELWQRQAADDLAVQHIMRTQALEAGARVDTLEDTASRRKQAGLGMATTAMVQDQGQHNTAQRSSYSEFLKCITFGLQSTEGCCRNLLDAFEKMEMFPEEIDRLKSIIGGSCRYDTWAVEKKRKSDDFFQKQSKPRNSRIRGQNTGRPTCRPYCDRKSTPGHLEQTAQTKKHDRRNQAGNVKLAPCEGGYVVGNAGANPDNALLILDSFDAIIEYGVVTKYQVVHCVVCREVVRIPLEK
ncbi:hypothetical protein Tco_0333191 [Tanacetum coccineum]